MNREETAQVMLMLMSALRLSRPVVDVELLTDGWHLALADVDADEAQRAATVLLREGSYFPEPARVRELVMLERTGVPDADEAWALIDNLIHRKPWPNISQRAGEALLEAVKSLGGISYLRASNSYQRDRDTFFKLWPQIRTRYMREAQRRDDTWRDQDRIQATAYALTAIAGEEPPSTPLPDGLMTYRDHFEAFYARQEEKLKDAPLKPIPRHVLDAGPGPAEQRKQEGEKL